MWIFFKQCLFSAVVGGMAGTAFSLGGKSVDIQLAFRRGEILVANHAERTPAPRVKNVGVGGSVGFVAPLATPFPQWFVCRG